MHKTLVIFTVDTEASIAGALTYPDQRRPVFEGPVDGVVGDRSEALGFLVETLNAFEIKATFFVETLHTRYFGDGPMGLRCDRLLKAGHDVQLHIHPCWRSFRDGSLQSVDKNDESTGRPESELVEIFTEAQSAFRRLTGQPARALRPGNFSAGLDTYLAMKEIGITVSSSLNVATRCGGDPALHLSSGQKRLSGILEFPVTCFSARDLHGRSGWRAMKLAGAGVEEMRHVLEQAHGRKLQYVTIITHPFEFLNKRDVAYRTIGPNRLVQGRLEKLCRFLDTNRDRFDVVTMGACADRVESIGEQAPVALSAPLAWTAKRFVENAASDLLWKMSAGKPVSTINAEPMPE